MAYQTVTIFKQPRRHEQPPGLNSFDAGAPLYMPLTSPPEIDVLIVGAGIAGASLAAALGPHRQVMMIEAEDMPGFHATGRSAAFWHESYGGVQVQPLSAASFATLNSPAEDFSEQGFLSPRAALTLGSRDEAYMVDAFIHDFAEKGVAVTRLSSEEIAVKVPGIRSEWCEGAYEPACSDIDVAGLHAAYLRAAKRAGVTLRTRAPMTQARWHDGGWTVEAGGQSLRVAVLVNAAGAWADAVAVASGIAPLGIQPYRRTVLQLRLGVPTPAQLPLVIHVGGEFYFKGGGEGRIWLSPHDETPDVASDVAPEEIDVAVAIDRLQSVVDWPIEAVERKWAGLRSFAPDRLPVFGPDAGQPAFVWCAGQGGFGIQTAPAIAGLLAAQLGAPHPTRAIGAVDPRPFAASRFA